MWLPQGGALKIENLQFTQYSIIMLLSSMHQSLLTTIIVQRKIWPNLEVAISLKPKRPHPPKLVYIHYTTTPTCMNFLSQFQSIKFF